jgi:hypothetical protein
VLAALVEYAKQFVSRLTDANTVEREIQKIHSQFSEAVHPGSRKFPRDARSKLNSFLNFLLRAEIGAQIASHNNHAAGHQTTFMNLNRIRLGSCFSGGRVSESGLVASIIPAGDKLNARVWERLLAEQS